MPTVADASVAIRGDLAPFNKDLKSGLTKADTQTKSFGKSLDTALSPKSLLLGAAGGAAAFEIVNFLGDATAAAGEFQDTVSASSVIFDEQYTPALEEWADTAHSSFGASKQDALAAANSIAVFGKAAGLSGQELVDFSTQLTQLGGDLASFFGGRTEDAIAAVGSALRGEFEPIRRYGVLLDDATLRQKAFEMGLISSTKNALTPQQKTLAAQAAIMEQTADAQGDFVRTSDGLMNSQRDLQAQWENMQIEIGEKLIPVMTSLIGVATDTIGVMGDLVDVLGAIGGAIDSVDSSGMIENITELQEAAHDKGMEMVGDWIGSMLKLPSAVSDATSAMTEDWANAWKFAGATTTEGGQLIIGATRETMDKTADVVDEGKDVVVGKFGEIPEEGADAMLDEQWRLKDATAMLVAFVDQALSPMQEKARIRAFLASKELANALTSNNPLIRAKAQEMMGAATDRLDELLGKGRKGGENLSRGVGEGIDQFSYLAFQAAARLASGVAGFLPVNSPPDNRKSALANIYGAGDNIVDAVAGGILRRLNQATIAAQALSGALNPTLPNPALGAVPRNASVAAGFAAAAGSNSGDINVYLPGRDRQATAGSIGRDLARLERRGHLRIRRDPPND